MYVGTMGKGNRAKVYLLESYRDGKKVKKRILQCFGHLSELTREDPLAVEKLKAKFDRHEEKNAKRAQEAAVAAYALNFDPKDTLSSLKAPEIIYSNYILRPLWKELEISKTINYLQKYYYKDVKYSIDNVVSTQCFLKIIDPSSVRKAYCHKGDLLGSPLNSISLDQMYDCLDFLYKHKDIIFKNINKAIEKKTNRNYSMVFYDVTNVYFECDITDEEKIFLRDFCEEELEEILTTSLEKELLKEEDIKKFYSNYCLDNFSDTLRQEIKCMLFLRMRGLSKEHRYDLPLISIAMIVDDNAIPIDFEIYSGCASEYKTMFKSIRKIKEKYCIKKTIVVADRGINSTSNLRMLLDNEYGFLVAQKVSNLKPQEKAKMFEEDGYRKYVILRDKSSDVTEENIIDIIKFKTIDYIKRDKNGNSVNCKLIFTHSKKREERDKKIIDIAIKKAENAIKNNIEIPSSKQSWIGFIEKDKKLKATSLDKKIIENKLKCAGYAGIVFHPGSNGSDELLNPSQIVNAYHNLVQIEDCFRIMKSNLGLRPMYVQLEEHINGHVICCVIALILLRILQIKLEKYNHSMTIDEIVNAIKDAKIVANIDSSGNEQYLSSTNYSFIYHNRQKLNEDNLRKLLQQAQCTPNLEHLMRCLGMQPLPPVCDRIGLMRSLNAKLKPSDPVIDPLVYDLVTGRLKERSEALSG